MKILSLLLSFMVVLSVSFDTEAKTKLTPNKQYQPWDFDKHEPFAIVNGQKVWVVQRLSRNDKLRIKRGELPALRKPEDVSPSVVNEWYPPLIVINEQIHFSYGTPKDVQKQLIAQHLPGVIDEREEKCLKAFAWSSWTDGVSTAVALTCTGVKEANPLLGSNPSILGITVWSYAMYKWQEHAAKKSNRYQSSADSICTSAITKFAATASNIVTLGGAANCL